MRSIRKLNASRFPSVQTFWLSFMSFLRPFWDLFIRYIYRDLATLPRATPRARLSGKRISSLASSLSGEMTQIRHSRTHKPNYNVINNIKIAKKNPSYLFTKHNIFGVNSYTSIMFTTRAGRHPVYESFYNRAKAKWSFTWTWMRIRISNASGDMALHVSIAWCTCVKHVTWKEQRTSQQSPSPVQWPDNGGHWSSTSHNMDVPLEAYCVHNQRFPVFGWVFGPKVLTEEQSSTMEQSTHSRAQCPSGPVWVCLYRNYNPLHCF